MQIGKVPMFPIPTGPLQLMRGPPGLVIIDTDNMGSKLTPEARRMARAGGMTKIATIRRCYHGTRWNHFVYKSQRKRVGNQAGACPEFAPSLWVTWQNFKILRSCTLCRLFLRWNNTTKIVVRDNWILTGTITLLSMRM